MPINMYMPPSPIRCGTKPDKRKNPGVSSLPISSWRRITRTVFAPLYAARKSQGEWSVEVVLHDA